MNWFSQLRQGRRIQNDVAEEIAQHLEEKAAALIAEGLSRKEAEEAARREFGNVTSIQERSRDVWSWTWLELAMTDVQRACRRLIHAPGFTVVSLLTLALGIGATTGIFTLLNVVLLKSLPVPNPQELLLVKEGDRPADKSRFSYPLFQHLQQQLPDSAPVAAMSWPHDFYVGAGNQADERATGQLVSGNYFAVFETHPAAGRLLVAQDDAKLSGSAVLVLSYEYWQRRFEGDGKVAGRKIEVNHVPFTIAGVAQQGFFGARPGSEPDFWIPLTMQSDVRYHSHYSDRSPADPSKPWVPQDSIQWLQLLVRMKDEAAAPHILSLINRSYGEERKAAAQRLRDPREREGILRSRLAFEAGQKGFAVLRLQFQRPLLLLMGMALMVLLIACANIANLLLARGLAREHAIAIELSIGASRARLLRQTLTECLLLAVCGGLCGIAIAFWFTSILPKWASNGEVAIPANLAPDAGVLFFAVVITVATGVLFGLAPAWQSTRVDPLRVLKANGRTTGSSGGTGRWSLRKTLVAAQVALSCVLLVGGGLFLRTLVNYSTLNPGFDRNHLVSVHLETHLLNYQAKEFLPLYRRIIEKVNAIPGVVSSSVATCALATGCMDSSDSLIADGSGRQPKRVSFQMNAVSLDYFKTVGIRSIKGRTFSSADTNGPPVALVNQTFAKRYFTDGNAIGKRMLWEPDGSNSFEIVGVVADARVNDIREVAPPLLYFAAAQQPGNIDSIDIRTAADPQRLVSQIRRVVLEVDRRLPIVSIHTLSEQVDRNLTQQRLIARLTLAFGLLALALACLGLYGVMAYTVQRRTSEIGVRLALGSNRGAMLWLVLKEALVLIAAGTIVGLALSALLMRLLTSFLYGLSSNDPLTTLSVAGLLLVVSMAASLIPAWQATRVNPMDALRGE